MENTYEENLEAVEAAEAMPNNHQPEEESLPRKGLNWKKIPKVIWLSAIAAVAVIGIVIGVISALTNTYKTPLRLEYKFLNTKESSDYFTEVIGLWNGFSKDELNDIIRIYMKSEDFEDSEEYLQDMFDDQVEYFTDMYGEDYKFSYKIEDKEKLDSDDLKEMRNNFKDAAKELKESIEETEDYDSDDWEDMADDAGIKKSEAKKLVKAMEALYEEWKSVDVTKGYELSVVTIIEGEELDEPEEVERTVYVYKINGRWVSDSALSYFFNGGLFS